MKKQGSEIQSYLFDRSQWTIEAAAAWLRRHKKKTPKVDKTDRYYRFRQTDPKAFEKMRTMTIAKNGIRAIVGIRSNPKPKTKRSWYPNLLVDLATPISIDLEDGRTLKFPLRGNWALCSSRTGRELWIVSRAGAKRAEADDDRAEKLYESFTGFEHDPIGALVNVKNAPLQRIGRARDIVYRSDKFARPGNRTDYVHAFDHYPSVSVDSVKSPKIVAIRGGRIAVRKAGITG